MNKGMDFSFQRNKKSNLIHSGGFNVRPIATEYSDCKEALTTSYSYN